MVPEMETRKDQIKRCPSFASADYRVEKAGKGYIIVRTCTGQRQRWRLFPLLVVGPLPPDALRYKAGAYTFHQDLPEKDRETWP
jgi:hypothetical protein